eukprot:2824719-Amphidinium_carterae.1
MGFTFPHTVGFSRGWGGGGFARGRDACSPLHFVTQRAYPADSKANKSGGGCKLQFAIAGVSMGSSTPLDREERLRQRGAESPAQRVRPKRRACSALLSTSWSTCLPTTLCIFHACRPLLIGA